ncbi:MAG: glyoxalase [Pseudobutyrivibrio ruminis]|uniref:Glyoxalase n=1 Tax=Pseudobutyrivibrio ruminis TaxID=46206 RepID=A0A927YM67_9FIRM|nr:glyoxalase [Pseudobutyrivibrio ruminis]
MMGIESCGMLLSAVNNLKDSDDEELHLLMIDNHIPAGARLEIMNKPDMYEIEKPINCTGYIHIAFSVGSKEKVDAMTEQLKLDGYDIVSGPRTTGDGYYESCIVGIEGNQIEITI